MLRLLPSERLPDSDAKVKPKTTFCALFVISLAARVVLWEPALKMEDAMSRIRSPNYPQVAILDAVEDARTLHQKEGQNFMPRDVVAKLLGYSSVNGASEKKTSALNAYGLIDRSTDREIRVSDLAVKILFPHDAQEKGAALAEAALSPNLFQEIREKWPTNNPSDENLKSYLVRRGFNQNAVEQVISVFRAAMDVADAAQSVPESPPDQQTSGEKPPMQQNVPQGQATTKILPPLPALTKPIMFDMETISGQYSFDNSDDLADFIEKLERIKPLLPPKN